jgi:hypothetical protein
MTTHTRIPGLVTAALLALTAAVGPAVAATAAPPEINQKDCEAAGGTFDRVQGVKSCTTTAQVSSTYGPFVSVYDGGFFNPSYRATWRVLETSQLTTTSSQKGNGDVTTQQTSTLISRQLVDKTCQATLFGTSYPASVSDCAALGLYPPA